MVPHRKILRALALAAYCRRDGVDYVRRMGHALSCTFPGGSIEQFALRDMVPDITPRVWYEVLIGGSNADPEHIQALVQELEIGFLVTTDNEDPIDVVLPPQVRSWREDRRAREFIETASLCAISQTVIAEDLRSVWGYDVDEEALAIFINAFADRAWMRGSALVDYENCIGPQRMAFLVSMRHQPRDYVRWKLGVPVVLDCERVLNRLISDAYYTERLIKNQAGGDALYLDDIAMKRLKMERDALFKAQDRLHKMEDARANSEQNTSAVRDWLEKVKLRYAEETPGEASRRLKHELEEENAQLPAPDQESGES